MSDINERLNTLLGAQGVMRGSDWRDRIEALERQRREGAYGIERVVPGELVERETGRFFRVRETFPLDTYQGALPLGSALAARPEQIALSACDEALEAFDPSTAVFLDTETTGLSGGAGTVAFLVGAGYFEDGAFVLEQCFMRDFDEEEPMLEYLGELFRRCETVVTYNGKAFDVPLLRSRFISNRMPYRLDSILHFDLLHAARRFWKPRLQDCSLGRVEEDVLGIQRQGDVPSHLIPRMWLDYLNTGDARPLGRVFYHHKMDILSLASLTGLLAEALVSPDGSGFEHAEDRLALMRLHCRQRRYEAALASGRRVLEQEEQPSSLRRECLTLMAHACRRLNDWDGMAEAWRLLLHENPKSLEARLELAKFHEHRARDLQEAERICAETLEFLDIQEALGHDACHSSAYREDFLHRLARIRRKMARQQLDGPPLPDLDTG